VILTIGLAKFSMNPSDNNPLIRINTEGEWYYGETQLERCGLIRLFYTVLKKEDNAYFLVTPVEKVQVLVDDVPYSVTQVEKTAQGLECTLNDETILVLGARHFLRIGRNHALYITLDGGFEARFLRSAVIQIAEWIQEEGENVFFIEIDSTKIYLGSS
jgi:uncharacterized protein